MPYIPITTYPTTGTRVTSLCPIMLLRAVCKDLDSISIIDVENCGGCPYYRDEDLFWVECGYLPIVLLPGSKFEEEAKWILKSF